MSAHLDAEPVLVVGAGIMGAGIAQIAAQAGHQVYLHDQRPGASSQARDKLVATLEGLVDKGKLQASDATAAMKRIVAIEALQDASSAELVVEAIVEDLDAKRALFRELEALLPDTAVFCTNTSSISVTAIGKDLQRPERLVGMHFFNPVPLMKLVEVVHGLLTAAIVANRIEALARSWGKVPVHTRSTPGFIVNRIARPFYAEALAMLQEQAGEPAQIDACLRAAGFRMGPCELMDLIGHDTNFSVTRSVYDANFQDKRYVPSLLQAELVAGGLLGRKSGRGFYTYPQGVPALSADEHAELIRPTSITVHGEGPLVELLQERLTCAAVTSTRIERQSNWIGLEIGSGRLVFTDGRTAQALASEQKDVAVVDWPLATLMLGATPKHQHLAYALAPQASAHWAQQAPAWLAALGWTPVRLEDTPGLAVARTVSMIVNEAADAVLQGVCTPEAADAAMKLGVNYPAGPFEWLKVLGIRLVLAVLGKLNEDYRGERYRSSPWLRRHLEQGI
ncbi:MAG: 3-hydroxyacyl-CoA dehydrogenase [Pseudomonadota bacterium]